MPPRLPLAEKMEPNNFQKPHPVVDESEVKKPRSVKER
jgi:hypothetical protein